MLEHLKRFELKVIEIEPMGSIAVEVMAAVEERQGPVGHSQ
jgi:hypothetical protein